MTTRTDFTDEEWERLSRAPLVAGMAISIADPGGPIEAFKETNAALRTIVQDGQEGKFGELVKQIGQDVAERGRHRENPMHGFRPRGADARDEILDELRAVNALLEQKLTPEEADQFREWLKTAAQRTALAAKEGGFLGFNAQRVSEGEQQMLDRLGEIFGGPAT
jgi:hypothetical protein